jgi:hypothetical protein
MERRSYGSAADFVVLEELVEKGENAGIGTWGRIFLGGVAVIRRFGGFTLNIRCLCYHLAVDWWNESAANYSLARFPVRTACFSLLETHCNFG